MKITDLMIGDFVKADFDPEIGRVSAIDKSTDCITLDFGVRKIIGVQMKDIQAVSLTSEFLEKNGFFRLDMYHQLIIDANRYFEYYEHESRLTLNYVHKNHRIEEVEKINCVNYIHQLQHAFNMCQIDKEFVL